MTRAGVREIVPTLRIAALALLALGLVAACRPVVRACSSLDRCEGNMVCVGGRCEQLALPAAITDAERIVLTPVRQSWVELGGAAALLLDFDLGGVALDRVVEAHLLVRRPASSTTHVAVHRVTGPWHQRSTSAAESLARVGGPETEIRLEPTSPELVRLALSAQSLRSQHGFSWAVRLDPTPANEAGLALAEASETGVRLELYLRRTQPLH